jgi:hypothetical protein
MRTVTENRAKNYRSTRIMQGQRIRALIAVSSYLFRHIVLRYVYPIRVLTRCANPKPICSFAESEFVEMDNRSWQRIFVAGGLWCIQRQLIQHGFVDYIKNQEKHHRKFSFEEEFRAILQRHGLEQDVRHLPD